jgi:hypothetical protein
MNLTSWLVPPVLGFLLVGCSSIDKHLPDGKLEYLNGNTPATVLEDFRRAWINQDVEHYATLLSDDYAFYFDPSTLETNPTLPEFWTRTEELEAIGQLFASDEINDVRLSVLEYDPVPEPVSEAGRERWLLIKVTDEKLEIDKKPMPGENEGTTFLVEGQPEHFHFRKGKTEADTLASSPTSGKYYIVRWDDVGRPDDTFGTLSVSRAMSWSFVKSLYNN